MPKCFITGLELSLAKSFLLDTSVARRAVVDLRKRLHALEGILEQLATIDQQEYYNSYKKKKMTRNERRLVCGAIADLFSESYPDASIFISWKVFSDRRKNYSLQKLAQNKENEK